MSWNYPPDVSELPDDGLVEEEYVFEICGEFKVIAYSEKDAEEQMKENLRELVSDAVKDGSIEIK